MIEISPQGRVCSFCGAVGEAASPFAGGYGAMICAACVTGFHGAFAADGYAGEVLRPRWEAMSSADLLGHLVTIVRTEQQVRAFLFEWVQLLRLRRTPWADIGQALGISRQAAWERFRKNRP